jgi:transposase
MSRFIEGEDRTQSVLFPERLDDYIGEDNPVRVIDAFVDELDLAKLGFDGVCAEETGRPGYHPATLLRIYIYGYMNRVQSSRRLERETQRNLELIWLTGRLSPDFKTIADFRRDNGLALRRTCAQFVSLCRSLKLFAEAEVAIDGSKFKAVNNTDRNFSERKLQARIEQLENSVGRYLEELDRADREPTRVTEARIAHVKHKIRSIRSRMKELAALEEQIRNSPDGQISLTDTDARCIATSGKGTAMVGYNVQTAVDTKHHLIVAHEVTNLGHDRTMLSPMAQKAREAIGSKKLKALADRGYFSGPQILDCEEHGITPLVPKTMTSNNRARGLFDKRDFHYLPQKDEYRCPSGDRAIFRFETFEKGLTIRKYWSSACPRCPMKPRCTTGEYRRITRWENEHVIDAMQKRLDRMPAVARIRRQTVEHPFATLKSWMGATHFLTRTLPNVSTEMSLHVLAYNLTRAVSIFGTKGLIGMIRA